MAWASIFRSNTPGFVDAFHGGHLDDAPVQRDVRFGFDVLSACPGVPAEPMLPKQVWADALAYEAWANHLAEFSKANFVHFEEVTVEAVKQARPA